MKALIEKVIYKNGEIEEYTGDNNQPYVSHYTFHDLGTKGKYAKQNLIRTLKKHIFGDIKNVKYVELVLKDNWTYESQQIDLENY